jgi:hypothetical protein
MKRFNLILKIQITDFLNSDAVNRIMFGGMSKAHVSMKLETRVISVVL